MSGGVCHLCFEGSQYMKSDFQQSLQNSESQEFFEFFCQFMFNDSSNALDEICMQCWKTLNDFGQFCERIRGIHGNLVEVTSTSVATGINKLDESEEVLEDEIDEQTVTAETNIELPMLSIESDFNDDVDPLTRRSILAPSVIKKLEQQLHFEAKVLFISEMCFDRISRFIAPECSTCKQPFESFDDCYEHYLVSHGRSAFWNCCNLLLETPYDLLDHLKYHECIDVFKCAACSKCFLSSNKLRYHIRRTHLPRPDGDSAFDCAICNKECRTLRLLMNHHKCHIRIDCPHCNKHISAANYDHHVRTSHATQVPKKRKVKKEKEPVNKKQKEDDKNGASGSSKRNDAPGRSLAINIEPNADGMYECDICNMKFKQISLVFSHRNKVHV